MVENPGDLLSWIDFQAVQPVVVKDNIQSTVFVKGDRTDLKGADVLLFLKSGDFVPCRISNALKGSPEKEKKLLTALTLNIDDAKCRSAAKMLAPPGVNEWKWSLDSFVDVDEARSLTVSSIKRMARGDLCVAVCGSSIVAANVETIAEEEGGRSCLQVTDWQPAELAKESKKFIRSQTAIFGKFKEQARLQGWNVNEKEIAGNKLPLENKEAAGNLRPGKFILIEHEAGGSKKSFLTSVNNAEKETGEIELDSPLPAGYTAGGTVIRANIVLAGHGETQPERILGSGNAAISSQEFLFPVSDVSFVADTTQASGVRADISVIVDGETWTQVSRFGQSQPTDPHYTVRMTEDANIRIVFGDGTNGRRLPTGDNNIRIAWRMGSGEAGNLKAGSFRKPAHPHPRIEAIDQPFDCAGGNDMESVTLLRRSAPSSLLTMERAVSVSDFAELAASQSSVWNARADLKSQGGRRIVCVTVVPAQGGTLTAHLSKELQAFLLLRAIPGVHIELKDFDPEILKLDVTLAINSERFDKDAVTAEVRKTLLQRFTLKNRAIGDPVYLSDIYQSVEAVRGVEYSICRFAGSDEQFLYPESAAHGVIYMNSETDIVLNVVEALK
jgi:hypothetical protein